MKMDFRLQSLSGRSIFDLLVEFTYLAIIFLVPIWFANLFPTYNIFEFNKTVVFQFLVGLLLILTIGRVIMFPVRFSCRPVLFLRRYIFVPFLFIVILFIPTILSIDPATSFFGSVERGAGYRNQLFYFLFFILLSFDLLIVDNRSAKFKETADSGVADRCRRIAAVAVFSSFLVSVYGILQIMGIDFLILPESPSETLRTMSSFGQPNFLASWLLLVIPLSLYLASNSRSRLWRLFFIVSFLVSVLCLFLTGSRGGLIAAFLVAFLFLAIYLFRLRPQISRRSRSLIFLVFTVFCCLAFLGLNRFSWGRLTNLSDLKFGSAGARLNFYQAAVDAIGDHPWLGYGPETAINVLFPYYRADWGITGDVGQLPDRAHNLFLDITLSYGFVGLLAYSLLWFFFFRLALRNIAGNNNTKRLPLAIGLGAGGYLASLFFSFSIVAGEVYFWSFLTLLVVIDSQSEEMKVTTIATSGKQTKYRIALALAAMLLLAPFLIRPWRALQADFYFNREYSILLLEPDDIFTALVIDEYRQEKTVDPVSRDAYDRLLAERLVSIRPRLAEGDNRNPAGLAVVRSRLEKIQGSLRDQESRNLIVKAKIGRVLEDWQSAEKYSNRVIELSPFWPLGYIERGDLLAARGDLSGSVAAYQTAISNLPQADDPRLEGQHLQVAEAYRYAINSRLAYVSEKQRDYQSAEEYFLAAYHSNSTDPSILKKVADMNFYRGNLQKAEEYIKHGWQRDPQDYNWPVALAALAYERGEVPKALEFLNQARSLSPDNSWLESLYLEYSSSLSEPEE